MRELFVYYRVRIGHEASAWSTVQTFQAALRQRWPGLATRLLRRPAEPGTAQTWMETYAMSPARFDADAKDSIDADCEQAIAAAARPLAASIDGARHTEVFVPVERPG